jgi:hypothetical protein
MNSNNLDSLRLLSRERHGQRLADADAERLAREIRGTSHRRPRLRLIVGFPLKPSRRAGELRLES